MKINENYITRFLLRLLDEGNENADKLAKETANNEQREISLKHCTYGDILRLILRLKQMVTIMEEKRNQTKRNKKQTTESWKKKQKL